MDLRTMVDQGLRIHAADAASPMKRPFNEGADGPVAVSADGLPSFGSSELMNRLGALLNDKLVPKKRNAQLPGISPSPWVQEVYPLQGYCVYQFDGKLYRQAYSLDEAKHTVSLVGEPTSVVIAYDAIKAGGPGSGCKGPNCGRHGGGKGVDKTHVPKQATVRSAKPYTDKEAVEMRKQGYLPRPMGDRDFSIQDRKTWWYKPNAAPKQATVGKGPGGAYDGNRVTHEAVHLKLTGLGWEHTGGGNYVKGDQNEPVRHRIQIDKNGNWQQFDRGVKVASGSFSKQSAQYNK